jgi:hypothetical protein
MTGHVGEAALALFAAAIKGGNASFNAGGCQPVDPQFVADHLQQLQFFLRQLAIDGGNPTSKCIGSIVKGGG